MNWDFIETLSKGGVIMVPIALAAVLALTLFFERIYSLQRHRVIPERLVNHLKSLLKEEKVSEAKALCEQHKSAFSGIILAALEHAGKSRERLKVVMEEVGKSAMADLERYINALGTIAGVSPLLGLLGTVTGMIRVFQEVTTAGVGDPRLLASGIWEAMLTTAAGLIVAIPALIAYRYLLSRVDRLALELEEISLELIEYLYED